MTKKILGIIFSIITVAILGFSITWSVINFDKVKKAFSGAELYTHEEMLEYGENQYNQGIQDKQDYVDLINDYRDTITTLQDSLAKANYSLAEKDNLLSQKTAEINFCLCDSSTVNGRTLYHNLVSDRFEFAD